MKTFDKLTDLTNDLADDLADRVEAEFAGVSTDRGYSNQSCSAYVEISFEEDESGFFKVRFSDHDDRHGSDVTVRVDRYAEIIEEDGEYIETRIDETLYETLIDEAMAAVRRRHAALQAA